jgi:D-proline reductase (dithiol) PrdB
VGLIARSLESAGIATLCLTSALSITQAVRPPRAVFLDFPLGHTAGRAGDAEGQRAILLAALRAFETLREPGAVVTLPFSWAEDDAWKDALAASHADDRRPRDPEPQYQDETDRARAEAALAAGGCPGCVFLDER